MKRFNPIFSNMEPNAARYKGNHKHLENINLGINFDCKQY